MMPRQHEPDLSCTTVATTVASMSDDLPDVMFSFWQCQSLRSSVKSRVTPLGRSGHFWRNRLVLFHNPKRVHTHFQVESRTCESCVMRGLAGGSLFGGDSGSSGGNGCDLGRIVTALPAETILERCSQSRVRCSHVVRGLHFKIMMCGINEQSKVQVSSVQAAQPCFNDLIVSQTVACIESLRGASPGGLAGLGP